MVPPNTLCRKSPFLIANNYDSPECGIVFYHDADDLKDIFGRVTVLEEDEAVVQRQTQEDVEMFGSRPMPSDPEEVELPAPPTSRSAPASTIGEQSNHKRSRQEAVTAVDWNSGDTPIEAWLNQSAVPTSAVQPPQRDQDELLRGQGALQREEKELPHYRRIHITTAPEPKGDHFDPMDVEYDIIFGAQIWYRNIVDRFPTIPRYLARRLAEANLRRAERLNDMASASQAEAAALAYKQEVQEHVTGKFSIRAQTLPVSVLTDGNPPVDIMRTTAYMPQLSSDYHPENERPAITTSSSLTATTYRVTLNAPTAMTRTLGEVPITYLNKGQTYWLSVEDLDSVQPAQVYRTFICLTFDSAQMRAESEARWRLWNDVRGTNEANLRGGEPRAIELVSSGEGIEQTADFDRFSILWGPLVSSNTRSCTICVRFNFLSTDFGYEEEVMSSPIRLCSRTECNSRFVPATDWTQNAGFSYCKIKLFRDHGAERKGANVTKAALKLEGRLASAGKMQHDSITPRKDHLSRSDRGHGADMLPAENLEMIQDMQQRLIRLQSMILSVRPFTELNLRHDEQGPETYRLPFQHSSKMPRSEKFTEMKPMDSFWTGGRARRLSASVHSAYSSMNSSLRGDEVCFDPSEQNPHFTQSPRRSERRDSFMTSPGLPPPPVKLGKKLSFECDICGKTIRVSRRREWQ
jgi:hypothetical protein